MRSRCYQKTSTENESFDSSALGLLVEGLWGCCIYSVVRALMILDGSCKCIRDAKNAVVCRVCCEHSIGSIQQLITLKFCQINTKL